MAKTILRFADDLQKISKDLNKAVAKPFRDYMKLFQRALASEYWSVPFGKRIWEWQKNVKRDKKGAPSVKIGGRRRRHYARWSQSNEAFIATVWVFGLAAKIEEGGRLRRHDIFGRAERKPGVMVPRKPVLDRIHRKLADKAIGELSDSFAKFVERTL